MDLHDEFFARIKGWAKKNNTSIEAIMALSSGGKWTQSVYYGWRKGPGLPKGENILALANYMGVSCDWLISGKEFDPVVEKYIGILRDLDKMDAGTLDNVRTMVSSLAIACEKKKEGLMTG